MKKILILAVLVALTGGLSGYCACPINNPGSCKADIGTGINDKLQDKVLPNNLNQMSQPNNTFKGRSNLGQPNIPENINMRPIQEQNTQPYDANCQFGNCLNNQGSGQNKN